MLLSLQLSLILLPMLSFAEPLHLEMTRRSSSANHDADYYNSMANHLRGKYGFKLKQKRTTTGVSMTNMVGPSRNHINDNNQTVLFPSK